MTLRRHRDRNRGGQNRGGFHETHLPSRRIRSTGMARFDCRRVEGFRKSPAEVSGLFVQANLQIRQQYPLGATFRVCFGPGIEVV